MDSTSNFVRLWTCHQAEVERYVATMVPRADAAAEVVQEVSVALWEKWAEYDPQRPFVPWAIRFAYLEVLKWRQRQARERLVFSDELLEQLHAAYEEEAPLMEARRQALDGCLRKLTAQERRWMECHETPSSNSAWLRTILAIRIWRARAGRSTLLATCSPQA